MPRPIIHIAAIAIVGILAYSNTLNSPFQFDDVQNIAENPIIRSLDLRTDTSGAEAFLASDEYALLKNRPAGYYTFALNYAVHGLDVSGYHIVNIAIHIINALLVYWLAALAFAAADGECRAGNAAGPALLAALLFVSHPVQTQAVTYIVQRFTSLAALFYLLSLALYARFRLCGAVSAKSIALYALSLLSAVLAMKTKEIAFTLPVAIALYEFVFLTGPAARRALHIIPFALTMLIIPLTLMSLGDMETSTGIEGLARHHSELSRIDYLLTQFRVIVTYLRLIALPVNQNIDYGYPLFHSLSNIQVLASLALLLSIIWVSLYLLRRPPQAGPAPRVAAFGILMFFISISVESSLIPISDVIFEHRLYLPLAGAAISAAALLTTPPPRHRATALMSAALVVLLASASFARNITWQSEMSLWEDAARKSPGKARPWYNTGVELINKVRHEEAIVAFDRAISLNPDYAEAWHNRGAALADLGRHTEALASFDRAISLNPDFADSWYGKGTALLALGRYGDALPAFERAIALSPELAEAWHNSGVALAALGWHAKALSAFEMANKLAPGLAEAWYMKGMELRALGRPEDALAALKRATSLAPDYAEAWNCAGMALMDNKKYDEAAIAFKRAIDLWPGYSEAGANLAAALRLADAAHKASTAQQ